MGRWRADPVPPLRQGVNRQGPAPVVSVGAVPRQARAGSVRRTEGGIRNRSHDPDRSPCLRTRMGRSTTPRLDQRGRAVPRQAEAGAGNRSHPRLRTTHLPRNGEVPARLCAGRAIAGHASVGERCSTHSQAPRSHGAEEVSEPTLAQRLAAQRQVVADAEHELNRAASECARVLLGNGRLRLVEGDLLKRLKKQLQQFNARTRYGRWRA